MGRDAKVKNNKRIILPKEDYDALTQLSRESRLIEREARVVAQECAQQQAAIAAKVAAVLTAHGLDPAKHYRGDDATCTLIAMETPA